MSNRILSLLSVLLLVAPCCATRAVADVPPATPVTLLTADFSAGGAEKLLAPDDAAKITLTRDPGEMVGGKPSLKGDSRASSNEWNEFFHSKPGLFTPKEAYRVSFDYRVLARDENAKFYALFRRVGGGGGSLGWQDWQGSPGATGHVELTFSPHNATDDILIIGIQHRGAIAINNIVIQTDPASRPPDLPQPQRTWQSPGGVTYYVDSRQGDDTGDGKSAKHPWRSLDRINTGTFAPGDRILLRSGSKWNGFLSPGGSGAAGKSVVLGRYGEGAKPSVDAGGKYLATLYLQNSEQWEISDLDIANRGTAPLPGLAGVIVRLADFGTAHHIHLRALDVHDVSGSNDKSAGGGAGITCEAGGATTKSRFDDLLIEGCHLRHTDRNGITTGGSWSRRDWFPHLHVVIRGNQLEDIGGDGIVPIGCDGALVEHNVVRGGRQRADDYAAGIWPWSCDNTVIQYNEVSGMRGTKDGEGFDSDWNCQNSLFQYNYSHDNDGGFMLICNDGTSKMPWSIGNTGTVIRYNVSQNDGNSRLFVITGPCRDTQIYNNTFYVGKDRNIHAVEAGNWGGDWTENTRFFNNVFYVAGKATFQFGGMRQTVFDHNVFWGDLPDRPDDPHAIVADPRLSAPGTGGNTRTSLRVYQPITGSPCLAAGVTVAQNGGRDFRGRPVPAQGPPDIGAFQVSTTP